MKKKKKKILQNKIKVWVKQNPFTELHKQKFECQQTQIEINILSVIPFWF